MRQRRAGVKAVRSQGSYIHVVMCLVCGPDPRVRVRRTAPYMPLQPTPGSKHLPDGQLQTSTVWL